MSEASDILKKAHLMSKVKLDTGDLQNRIN